MRNRVQSIQNETVAISTFHSFGSRFLRDWAEAAGLSRKFSIYDEDDSLKVIKTVLAELGIKEKKGDARIIKTLISEAKNELKKLDEVGDEDTDLDTLKQFDQIFNQYQAHLKIADSVDFDDLLYLPLSYPSVVQKILPHPRFSNSLPGFPHPGSSSVPRKFIPRYTRRFYQLFSTSWPVMYLCKTLLINV